MYFVINSLSKYGVRDFVNRFMVPLVFSMEVSLSGLHLTTVRSIGTVGCHETTGRGAPAAARQNIETCCIGLARDCLWKRCGFGIAHSRTRSPSSRRSRFFGSVL